MALAIAEDVLRLDLDPDLRPGAEAFLPAGGLLRRAGVLLVYHGGMADGAMTRVFRGLLLLVYLSVFPFLPALNNPNENTRVYLAMALVDHGTQRDLRGAILDGAQLVAVQFSQYEFQGASISAALKLERCTFTQCENIAAGTPIALVLPPHRPSL